MPTNIFYLYSDSPKYPSALLQNASLHPPDRLTAIGNLALLQHPLLALFCSVKCPGDLILKTYDFARHLCTAGVPTIGGFQSPMEKESLTLLLRGDQPIVVCPARAIHTMRVPASWRPRLERNSLLILSPFRETQHRATAQQATQRNHLVAALADQIFVAHAAPGGKTESFCEKILDSGKTLLTFDAPVNAPLIAAGARPIRPDYLPR